VGQELQRHLQQRSQSQQNFLDTDVPDSFYIADLGEVYRQLLRWKKNLPRVEPFYAVKCNPDRLVMGLLSSFEVGFDCASKAEIEQVLALDPPVPRRNIIYANPCKAVSHIGYAHDKGVNMMTFDNADELEKIRQHYPSAELLLRIWTNDSNSQCQLSHKFGASEATFRPLLECAKEFSLNVIGVSFHVGSGSRDLDSFSSAIDSARQAFDIGRELGFEFAVLDVGGGFCHDDFESVATGLGAKIEERFPLETGVRIISEPGRYFVASAFTLATKVIGRRCGTEANPGTMCMFPTSHTNT
jgi:ornithine decarboxylase